jgi:hypothetical protein
MSTPEIPPDLLAAVPGTLGSALAALWMRDESLLRKIATFAAGSIFAVGATPELAPHLHLGPFVLAFLLGAGSMVVMRKTFETLQAFPLGRLLRDTVRHYLKLPPEPPTTPGGL